MRLANAGPDVDSVWRDRRPAKSRCAGRELLVPDERIIGAPLRPGEDEVALVVCSSSSLSQWRTGERLPRFYDHGNRRNKPLRLAHGQRVLLLHLLASSTGASVTFFPSAAAPVWARDICVM